jgi:3-oxoacyl-[acyl-carrier protein] reductase
VRRLGLPNPYPLRRDAALATPVLVGGAGRVPFLKQLETGAAPYGALVFDASDIVAVSDLRQLHDFFHPVITELGPCGRVIHSKLSG